MPHENKPTILELKNILSETVRPFTESPEFRRRLEYADCPPNLGNLATKEKKSDGTGKRVVMTKHSPEDLK